VSSTPEIYTVKVQHTEINLRVHKTITARYKIV